MLLARRSSNSFSYTPLEAGCNMKLNNTPTLPLITLTESLLGNNNTQYENLHSCQQRQRSRSINVVIQTNGSSDGTSNMGTKFIRRAKTPSPKRSSNDFLNNKRKTPSPRSLSPKYSSSRRSSNASIASNKLDVGSSWEEFGNYYKKSKTPGHSPQRTLSNLQLESLELYLKTYNVALLGSENVGKKCLLSSFGESEEPTSPNLSITIQEEGFDFGIKVVNDSNALSHMYKYDGLILLYSITDRDSYKYVKGILDKLTTVESKVILLVGNKCDLERGRCVSANDPFSLANRYNIKHIETSVQLSINIDDLKEILFKQFAINRTVSLVKQNLIEKLIKWGNRKWKSCVDIKGL